MQTYYHVTPTVNLDSILKSGLVPTVGERSQELNELPGIFLFPSLDDVVTAVMNWLGDYYDDDVSLTLLQVSIDESILESVVEWELICREPILPEFIEIHPLALT